MLTFTSKKMKKSFKSENNILTIYSGKSHCIEIANTLWIDTGIILDLPENSTAHLTTKIETIIGPKVQRLWLAILNESYFGNCKIEKGDIIGYLVIEPKNLKIYYEKNPQVKARRSPNNYLPKKRSKNWKKYWQKKKEVSNRRVPKQVWLRIGWERRCKSSWENYTWYFK